MAGFSAVGFYVRPAEDNDMATIDRVRIGSIAAGIPELAVLCAQNSIELPAEQDGFVNVYYIMKFWAQCLINSWKISSPSFPNLACVTEDVATNGTDAVRNAMQEFAFEILEADPSVRGIIASLGPNTQEVIRQQYDKYGIEQ